MTVAAPPRWAPDEQLVAAVLSAPKANRKMADLAAPDRAWVVAGLTLHGLTAKDIADRLGCSVRLVKSIRAEDMTQVCMVAQTDTRTLGNELRAERCDHAVTRRALAESGAANERLRMQLDQLLDARLTGQVEAFRCGHPIVPYNTYEHGGKRWCRECGRERKAVSRRNGLVAV